MLQAKDFVEIARRYGFKWYVGVPCSYLTPFINYVINDPNLHYLSSTNEGDAVATASGITIGGNRAVAMMQNSGLGNAVNPLTSLCHTFKIPILLICTLRGDQAFKDEPQHELMGQITTHLLELMGIPWEFFPQEAKEIETVLQRADEYMTKENLPYALVMRKGTVAHETLRQESIPVRNPHGNAPKTSDKVGENCFRAEVLKHLVERVKNQDTVIIATTGYTGRELYSIDDRPNHLYMVGSMGCASSLGLGLSLVRPDLRVIVLDGDGAGLMRMGNFATIGTYAQGNFIHILLDNHAHDSTGAQATVSTNVEFSKIAQACGYGSILQGNDVLLIDEVLRESRVDRPSFLHLKIKTGTMSNLPRPSLTPSEVLTRLMNHIHVVPS